MTAVALVHLVATATMAGLIWFVQVVHYPLFAAVGPDRFVAYEQRHTQLTSYVVGPLMGTEAVTALWLLATPGEGGRLLPAIGLVLLGVIQASTVGLQVPLHRQLSQHHDPSLISRLVATNWVRTIGWSARVPLAAAIVATA